MGIGYRDLAEPDHSPELEPEILPPTSKSSAYDDLSFVASLPVKLPPIASEDLEHFDDKALDAQFDRKLEIIDEDTGPIPGAAELIRKALGQREAVTAVSNGSGTGTAAAPARARLNIQIPDFNVDDAETELPWPGDAAGEDELLAYANSQSTVKRLRRVFRAKVTAVAKTTEPR